MCALHVRLHEWQQCSNTLQLTPRPTQCNVIFGPSATLTFYDLKVWWKVFHGARAPARPY